MCFHVCKWSIGRLYCGFLKRSYFPQIWPYNQFGNSRCTFDLYLECSISYNDFLVRSTRKWANIRIASKWWTIFLKGCFILQFYLSIHSILHLGYRLLFDQLQIIQHKNIQPIVLHSFRHVQFASFSLGSQDFDKGWSKKRTIHLHGLPCRILHSYTYDRTPLLLFSLGSHIFCIFLPYHRCMEWILLLHQILRVHEETFPTA